MLRSWRDRVRIVLSPDRLAMIRLRRGGGRPSVTQTYQVAVDPADEGGGWASAMTALMAVLTTDAWRAADATVVLSNRFVRYQLISWSDSLDNDVEREAFVRHHFAETYGDVVDRWALRWSDDAAGVSRVACAVDRALLARLTEGAQSAGLRLRSIQPYLMSTLNYWRADIGKRSLWFLLAEPKHLCVSRIRLGRWEGLRCYTLDEDWPTELPHILQREWLLADDAAQRDQTPLYVYAPEQPALLPLLGKDDAWSIHPLAVPFLPGLSADDAAYAMALSVS